MPRYGSKTPLKAALDGLSGMLCRGCSKQTFSGYHFTCLICLDYSLCEDCHFKKHISKFHTNCHSMQCVGVETADEQLSLTCPFCSERGFYLDNLASHIHIDHSGETAEVKCPVCVAQGNSVGLLKYEELRLHLSYIHELGALTTQRQSMIIEYISQYVNMATSAGIYGASILRGIGYDFFMFPYQFSGNLPYDEYGYIYTEGKDPRNRG
ncbi:E3 ubiquitin-protein ligase KCMF1 [Trichinella zimbabwensis]|uniref:E3 ubiquitin-protein ligase KCMF1 n=1 Tax=Trichinella zimbabwensis TaxID=268475 RepID=A0A0V1HII7_9BILA|nr:E3 ubiquitin-protein ligase KCMF1 [Trichinella zimbabwensis]